MKALVTAIYAGIVFGGCPVVSAQTAVPGVAIYDSTQIAFDRYQIIRRLSVEGPRSSFSVPAQSDVAGAMRALMDEATRAGADGVVNVQCMTRSDNLLRPAGHYCYGNAIKLKTP